MLAGDFRGSLRVSVAIEAWGGAVKARGWVRGDVKMGKCHITKGRIKNLGDEADFLLK